VPDSHSSYLDPGRPIADVQPLTDKEFRKIGQFVYKHCGINLGPAKKTMVYGRLSKRLRALGIPSFGEYFEFAAGPHGSQEELTTMINLLTTNKTDFFREPDHFDFLKNVGLDELMDLPQVRQRRHLQIWSAGCSSGEEPYTLAFVVADFLQNHLGITFSILATDISTFRLEEARRAIYTQEQVEPVPIDIRSRYFLKGINGRAGTYRVGPKIRRLVKFRALNLMDRDFGIPGHVDVIFCRNVSIYFDRPTQKALIGKFYEQLAPGGFYFIGHSETLQGVFDRFRLVVPTIYRKQI